MKATVPVIEVADDAQAVGARCPNGERDSTHAAQVADVRAEFFVESPVPSLSKQMLVERAERRHEGVRVAHREDVSAGIIDAQEIREELHAVFENNLEEACRVQLSHRALAFALDDQL